MVFGGFLVDESPPCYSPKPKIQGELKGIPSIYSTLVIRSSYFGFDDSRRDEIFS